MFSQEYIVHAGVPQGHILGSTVFLLYINDLTDNVICNIDIDVDDTTRVGFSTWAWLVRCCELWDMEEPS